MKRPPQLWVLSIGILCLSLLPSTNAVRATSLIFAKTTTTTSTEAPKEGETKDEVSTVASEANADNNTVTKPPLTGIPQIDYIWDPNLPFELKNYNLSDYPFYDGLPEEIDFKCDGLHDGFYASVPHKCQVYHHCLYGTRYDFLCANFTAFDQKTFICHFVSEVDCVNSKNYWHRNDALYKTAETTTVTPVTTTSIPFTPSPALNPALRRPSSALAPGGGARRRRPYRRRRPQYEYYYDDDEEYDVERGRDEYYDDVPLRNSGRRRTKRPRPNRRPEYEEYDEYEEDRYDRRPGRRDEDRDRRPYDRREDDRRRPTTGGSKNKDRKVEEEDARRPTEDRKRPLDDRRRPVDDEYERRPYDRRKPPRDRYEDEEEDRRRPYDRKRPQDEEDRRYRPKDSKMEQEERRYRPKDPKTEDDRDERRNRKPADEGRSRPKESKVDDRSRPIEEPKVLIKGSSGSSVYDRPRAPPIIRRPVPKVERDKYGYNKPVASTKIPAVKLPEDEEYYDDYEEEPKLPAPKPTRKSNLDSRESEERRVYARPRRPQIISKKIVAPFDEIEEAPRRPLPKRPLDRSQERNRDQNRSQERSRDQERSQERPRDQERSQERSREQVKPKFEANNSNKKAPIEEEEEYIDEYEEVKNSKQDNVSRERSRPKFISKENREPSLRSETPSKEITSREREHRPEPVVKIVKRPFLPSRGGNPYVGRGLQPVGSKALDITTDTTEKKIREEIPQSQEQIENFPRPIDNQKPIKSFQTPNNKEEETNKKTNDQEETSKSNEQSKQQSDEYYDEEEFKPVTSRPKNDFRNFNLPRTTQKPKVSDNYRNPLDINENEYDVTLNDALNPTLPNLPVRSIPTGFSNGRDGYITQNYQRSRLLPVESAVLSPASSDYVYQVKQPQSTQAQALRYNPYVTVQQLNYRQSPASSGQYYTTY